MAANDNFFAGSDATGSYLSARGFNAAGDKSGGIVAPTIVELPAGAIIVRLYHAVGREFGEWWSTVSELQKVFGYFGRTGVAAATGRPEGKGILQATLAIRHDWGGNSPDHLGRFICAETTDVVRAYFGPGDDAPSADKKQVQKAVRILAPDDTQMRFRQLFLPQCWKYQNAFRVILTGSTDTGLLPALRKFAGAPFSFESMRC